MVDAELAFLLGHVAPHLRGDERVGDLRTHRRLDFAGLRCHLDVGVAEDVGGLGRGHCLLLLTVVEDNLYSTL